MVLNNYWIDIRADPFLLVLGCSHTDLSILEMSALTKNTQQIMVSPGPHPGRNTWNRNEIAFMLAEINNNQ
jgi:hypothetical protein